MPIPPIPDTAETTTGPTPTSTVCSAGASASSRRASSSSRPTNTSPATTDAAGSGVTTAEAVLPGPVEPKVTESMRPACTMFTVPLACTFSARFTAPASALSRPATTPACHLQ
ncbi:hypothetical protein [Saccharopolyspora erythraea]|uniref:hypothetical protein n=1 Tax=Saccharopolyspora erythraea TaxID=1836 RepID=UPI00138B0C9B|nr:hypothetical protein [Saccharopolyspora erythraea]QRK92297.1 hypothetical protein JQX30_13820 [Saccharopolyspora erythraea]